MDYKTALELVVGVLQRAPISKLEGVGLNEALRVLNEALTPKVVNDGPCPAEEPIQTK